MTDYITTSQAAKILKVSDRTIRNRLKQFSASFPQLSAYFRKEGNKILIDKRLVKANFEPLAGDLNNDKITTKTDTKQTYNRFETGFEEQPETGQKQAENSTITAGDLMPIFNQQLSQKDKQIEALTERNRELTIIIGRMQAEREKILIDTAKDTHPTTEPQPPIERKGTPPTQGIIIGLLLFILLVVLMVWLDLF